MAGSAMAFTYDEGNDGKGQHCNVKVVVVAWTSDASAGTASGTCRKVVGRLIKAVTVPGAAGAAPSDNYDITVTDEQSVDVLAACDATIQNRSTSATQEVYLLLLDHAGTALAHGIHPVVCNALTFSIANAGNSKTGSVYLYYEPI